MIKMIKFLSHLLQVLRYFEIYFFQRPGFDLLLFMDD